MLEDDTACSRVKAAAAGAQVILNILTTVPSG